MTVGDRSGEDAKVLKSNVSYTQEGILSSHTGLGAIHVQFTGASLKVVDLAYKCRGVC